MTIIRPSPQSISVSHRDPHLAAFYLQFISMIFPETSRVLIIIIIIIINSKVYLYADNASIFVKGKSVEAINSTLNSKLEKVSKWLQKLPHLKCQKNKINVVCHPTEARQI